MTEEDWTEEQKAAWRKGTWTPEQLDALDRESEEHLNNCEECQEGLDSEDVVYCPVGESLEETYAQAITEYSWQPDFNPDRVQELRGLW